jgi:hypothetical protein
MPVREDDSREEAFPLRCVYTNRTGEKEKRWKD